MGSKGRIPPPHHRHQIPPAGMVPPEAFGPGTHPMPGLFPPFEMLPPPEVMEHKLAAQNVEMQHLATENKRLAATHGTLRQELAMAQHELQMLHGHIGSIKADREQQMQGLLDKIAKMESELKNAESVKGELQQARVEAEKLVVTRQELVGKVHMLNQELHKAHTDVQLIPSLMSELESLRQEHQRCRVSYDSEKKLFSDHLESLQAMERNYMAMAKELDKLRAHLSNTGVPYGANIVNNESVPSGRLVGQHGYADDFSGPQVQGHTALPSTAVAGNAGNSANLGFQSGPGPTKTGFDALRVPGYDPQRGLGYDPQRAGYDVQRVHAYDPKRRPGFDMQRGAGYDPQRPPAYDPAQRMPGYDVQRGPFSPRGAAYDLQRGTNSYDAALGAVGLHGQVAQANVAYRSATPPTRAAGGEAPARGGGNPVRK